jgi:hypothetical protein
LVDSFRVLQIRFTSSQRRSLHGEERETWRFS